MSYDICYESITSRQCDPGWGPRRSVIWPERSDVDEEVLLEDVYSLKAAMHLLGNITRFKTE